MKFARSGTGLRNTATGLVLERPTAPHTRAALQTVCSAVGATTLDSGWFLPIPQTDRSGERIDSTDRVQVGAALLRRLIAAGL